MFEFGGLKIPSIKIHFNVNYKKVIGDIVEKLANKRVASINAGNGNFFLRMLAFLVENINFGNVYFISAIIDTILHVSVKRVYILFKMIIFGYSLVCQLCLQSSDYTEPEHFPAYRKYTVV